MVKPLIIVESPTKIKTLKKYVGKGYNVAASAGHIRDLPVKKLGIDVDDNFKAQYVNIKDKSKIISNLKKTAKDTMDVYLAPDPDREGEAIAFHIMDILKKRDENSTGSSSTSSPKKESQKPLKTPWNRMQTNMTPSRPGGNWTVWWGTRFPLCYGRKSKEG